MLVTESGINDQRHPAIKAQPRPQGVVSDNSDEQDAGGSRTHFHRFAAGCLAVWLQHQINSRQFRAATGCPTGVEPALLRPTISCAAATPRAPSRSEPHCDTTPDPSSGTHHRVDRRGIAPRSPACKAGVLLLDQQPNNLRNVHVLSKSSRDGGRTHTHQPLRLAALPICLPGRRSNNTISDLRPGPGQSPE